MARLLVVEDDPHIARMLQGLLEHHGHHSVHAESGEAGLLALGSSPFDLVLLDVRLPGLSGFETCQRIREVHGSTLPVVIVTALGDSVSLQRGYEAGADDFLTKPINTPALALKIRALLRIKALHDEVVESREEARRRARDLALLHDIGRDWSLVSDPEDLHRMVTERLARLIGAPICGIGVFDRRTSVLVAALPVHGLDDATARLLRYDVPPSEISEGNLRADRPYVSNRARGDWRLSSDTAAALPVESVVLVPMISEGEVLGVLGAANKPDGFTDADVQLLTVFAGPAATFFRGRALFERERAHAKRLERLSSLAVEMVAVSSRPGLVELVVSRVLLDLGCQQVRFYSAFGEGDFRLEWTAGDPNPASPVAEEIIRWALRSSAPLPGPGGAEGVDLAVPVRAGGRSLGVLRLVRKATVFDEDETNLLATIAGQFALALVRVDSELATVRMAAQMATLYDLGLETAAVRNLDALFARATEEAGRLVEADHTSVVRLASDVLKPMAAWARGRSGRPITPADFRLGEGVAGRVAIRRIPALVNDPASDGDFVEREDPVGRLACVPLQYWERGREEPTVFGVLNATREPGALPFTREDLGYLARFGNQLSIAVANSTAFEAERERSEQLALVNGLLREIVGILSPEGVLAAAVKRIQETFRFAAVVALVPEAQGGIFRVSAAASERPPREPWGSLPLAVGLGSRALRSQTLAQGSLSDPDSAFVALVPAATGGAALPVFSGGDVVAVLEVQSDSEAAFRPSLLLTLQTLADGIGIVWRSAELYEALDTASGRLLEMDRMKTELVHVVAHDLRSPIASILGHAALAIAATLPEASDARHHLEVVERSGRQMARLVERTLQASRLDSGQFSFEFALADLGSVVRNALTHTEPGPSHTVRLECPEEPLPVWVDSARVAEVLDNLISNAIKYWPEGGEVLVRVCRQRESVTVTVEDRGIGIDPSDASRLFRPFSRLRNPAAGAVQGFGLGLSIARRIAAAHGGHIEVESRLRQGARFIVTLPLYGAAGQGGSLALVAAEDTAMRRVVRRVAEEQGYVVHEVHDGVSAVEAALRLLPAIVVVDRLLPRLSAADVATRLAELEATRSTPVVALGQPDEMGDAGSLFKACVGRPPDLPALRAALGLVVAGDLASRHTP